jgi:hypothetical protein
VPPQQLAANPSIEQNRQYSQLVGSPSGVAGSGSPGAGSRAPAVRATGSSGSAAPPISSVASVPKKPRRDVCRASQRVRPETQ